MIHLRKIILKVALLPVLLLNFPASAQTNGQNPQKQQLGISFSSFGKNDVFRFQSLDGGGSTSGDGYFAIGLTYIIPLNHWLEAETGIEYIRHKIILHPDFMPGIEMQNRKANVSILNLPFTLRANFGKYFFANGGLLLDIDASSKPEIDNQSGIGGLLGMGVRYDFDFGISLFLNPYIKSHALIPFSYERYPQRTFENGFRLGATLNF
jgi:hypothetical protein